MDVFQMIVYVKKGEESEPEVELEEPSTTGSRGVIKKESSGNPHQIKILHQSTPFSSSAWKAGISQPLHASQPLHEQSVCGLSISQTNALKYQI
ncbi:hypothetical protein DAPPUDRAFT_340788 [Daphnia pulex]|uniref:Uncharacterized protein n=1 Tax=Daphnia pulex TaxID=6669 RepID=E9I4R1_DAPPU|nr:hypothetical protein DAPPUDRAFT_340788 [Daphnia pulex]|eukprot:EFX61018.1 hypothetical protein DAPPUDRAFT_340788 [Daphnia pulex]